MHWSLQHGFDFTAALDRARYHYDAELLEERLRPSDHVDGLLQAVDAFLELLAGLEGVSDVIDDEILHSESYVRLQVVLAKAKGGA